MLSLGPGEAARQLTDVVRADQLAYGGVVRWRHGPVIAGCAAAPDPPPRVLAPELRKLGIPVVPARPGVHRGQRQVAAGPRCCRRRARAWMPAGAMQLPPPGRIRGAGQTKRHRAAARSCISGGAPRGVGHRRRSGPAAARRARHQSAGRGPGISSCRPHGPPTALHARPVTSASRRRPRKAVPESRLHLYSAGQCRESQHCLPTEGERGMDW